MHICMPVQRLKAEIFRALRLKVYWVLRGAAVFRLDHNPQPSLAWTQHSLEMIDEHGEKRLLDVPFTFADWATLNTAYHRYFLPVDAASQTENLVPLVEYLDNNKKQNIGKIPFIWMVDKANILHKVAVSWPVVIATQERLDFWRFLQENSGINNYHVAHALEEARIAMSEKYDHEVDQLKREHQEDINNIKREEASRVMENLASFLLELDIHSPGQRKPILTQVPIEKDQAFTEVAPVTSPEDKLASQPPVGEEVLTIDPYIDTALCTTCHECINKNKAMFRYNAIRWPPLLIQGLVLFDNWSKLPRSAL